MTKKILEYEDALRAMKDPIVAKLHWELIKLDLVTFSSGYVSVMQGVKSENS